MRLVVASAFAGASSTTTARAQRQLPDYLAQVGSGPGERSVLVIDHTVINACS